MIVDHSYKRRVKLVMDACKTCAYVWTLEDADTGESLASGIESKDKALSYARERGWKVTGLRK